MTNLLAFFVYDFIKRGRERTLELFYTSFLENKALGHFDFYEAIPFGARMIKILQDAENSRERKLLVTHLRLLYYTYFSLNPFSKRTLLTEENDFNEDVSGFEAGNLNTNEFNQLLTSIIKTYVRYKIFYRIVGTQVTIYKFDEDEDDFFKWQTLELLEKGKQVFLSDMRNQCKLNDVKSLRSVSSTTLRGCIEAKKIHKIVANAVYDIISKNDSCVWCNPKKGSKQKCINCIMLYRNYQQLRANYPRLPKDLNQIIKRENNKYKSIKERNMDIQTKIRKVISRVCNNNTSGVVKTFMASLNDSFPLKSVNIFD